MSESTDQFVHRLNTEILEKQLSNTSDSALKKMVSTLLVEEHLKSSGAKGRTRLAKPFLGSR